MRVQGSGSRFRGQGSGFRVQDPGSRVQGPRFRVQGSEFRVQSSGFRVPGSGFRVQGSGVTQESFSSTFDETSSTLVLSCGGKISVPVPSRRPPTHCPENTCSPPECKNLDFFFFLFVNLQPLKKRATTDHAPCDFDKGPSSIANILKSSWSSTDHPFQLAAMFRVDESPTQG